MSSLNNNKPSVIVPASLTHYEHNRITLLCTAGKQLLSPSTEAAALEILIKRLAELRLVMTTLLFHNDKNGLRVELIRLNAVCSTGG